jgi:hypothetical protein
MYVSLLSWKWGGKIYKWKKENEEESWFYFIQKYLIYKGRIKFLQPLSGCSATQVVKQERPQLSIVRIVEEFHDAYFLLAINKKKSLLNKLHNGK